MQLAAACAALSVWAFGALARWRFDDTGVRIDESQAAVEKAVMAMGNRIGLQMSQLDDQGLDSIEFRQAFQQALLT